MINWIVGRIRWILIAAAVGGPVFAYLGFSDIGKIAKLEAEGATTSAVITEAYSKDGRRSGTTYKVSLEWTDASGGIRTAEDITIDSGFANDIIQGDMLMVEELEIRYLEADPAAAPIVIASIPGEKETAEFMKLGGIGGGIVGILGSILMFLFGRKKKAATDEPS